MSRLRAVEVAVGVLLSLTAVALGVRFGISAGGLWRDEVSTVNLALRPTYRQVLESLHFDSAPALYPTLLRLWLAPGFSDQDEALRMLGVVMTIAAVAVVWLTARALGVAVPLLALSLFAVHGLVVQTVSSVKPYGVGAVLALAAFGAAAGLTAAPTVTRLIVAAVLAVASVQAGYQNVAVIVPATLVMAGFALRRDRRTALMLAGIAALAFVSVLPYAPMLSRSQQWRALVQGQITPTAVAAALERAFSDRNAWVAMVWVATGALAIYVAVRAWRTRPRDPVSSIVAAAAVSVASLVPFLMLAGRPPQPWHCVHVLGVAALAVDVAWASTGWLMRPRIVVAVAAALAILPGAVERTGIRQTNLDRVARTLEQVVKPRDLVVVNPWWLGLPFTRYYHGPARFVTLPPIDDLTVHRYDLLRARMMSPAPLAPLHTAIVDTLQQGGRVWLVGGFKPFFVAPGEQPVLLPPAPGAPSGWSDLAYANAWATQTGYLVQNAARTWRVMPSLDEGKVQPLEQVSVILVEGFRAP
jgi:hypothetical protein